MTERNDARLPVHGSQAKQDEAPSCSPAAYVSNEEAALVAAMRQLKSRADTVRQRLDREASDVKRGQLEAELGELRDRWRELAIRRESAYRRKMVMLGHLPPKALLE